MCSSGCEWLSANGEGGHRVSYYALAKQLAASHAVQVFCREADLAPWRGLMPLLPPGNVEAWAEALRQLMAEPERITRMSAAQRGEKVKPIEENAAEMEALYEKILAGRAPSGS